MVVVRPRGVVRGVGLLSVGFAVLLLLSGPVRADTHAWTTQADFSSGTLVNVNATASPGNLTLNRNATAFSPYAGNPVFTPNPSGWDNGYVIPTTVLQFGSTWVMWYTGSNSSGTGIGRATSTDGIHWTRNPTTPLLQSFSWPVVLYDSGVYKMWYEYTPGPYMATDIDYATSTDGISWTPYAGNPVLTPSASGFDSFVIGPGGVVHDSSGYRLWYSGNDGSSLTYEVGLANSTDGIKWTKYGGNPIITPPLGGWWDSERVLPCGVMPWGSGLLMSYVATDSSFTQRIALATSADGITWTGLPGPSIDVGPAGSWDSYTLSRCSVALDRGNLTMWYGGSSTPGVWDTGVAYAPAYAPQGSFVSSVLDSGGNGTTWVSLFSNATTPSTTQVALTARSGDNPTPDATWSFWSSLPAPGGKLSIPRSRYIQVGANLLSSDGSATPVLQDITLTYLRNRVAAPTAVFPGAGAWTANTTGTFAWTFQDPDSGDTQGAYELQTASDPGFVDIAYDTGIVNGSSSQSVVPIPPTDGTWYWRVRTEDNWGAWGPYSTASSLRVDRTPPTMGISFGSPTLVTSGTRYVTSDTLITLTPSDGAQGIGTAFVLYSVDQGLPAFYTVPFRVNVSDGQHFLRISAIDFLGNLMVPETVNLSVDDTGPTTSIGLTAMGSGFGVTLESTDVGSGVTATYVSVDGAPWSRYAGAFTVDGVGSHEVRAYAVDALGNQGAVDTATFTIPNLQPYVAGLIGVVGLVFGVWIFRRGRTTSRTAGALTALLGASDLTIGVASVGTGIMGIPPWVGAGLGVDIALAAGIVVLLIVAWRSGPREKGAGPPSPAETGGPPREPS